MQNFENYNIQGTNNNAIFANGASTSGNGTLPEYTRSKNMSLCLCVAYRNTFYLAADSQSSLSQGIGYTFENNPFKKAVSFTQQKIYKINDSIFGYYTGDDYLKGISVPQHIEEATKNYNNDFYAVSEAVVNFMNSLYREFNTHYTLFSYIGNILQQSTINYDKKEDKYILTVNTIEPGTSFNLSVSGATWATALADFAPWGSEEGVKFVIEKLYRDAEIVGRFYDNCVGGPTHILKVTPEGYSWIVGGYDL